MQKTDPSRTTNYTSRVDKPLEQKVGVIKQHRPQYLDVALKQAVEQDNKKSDLKSAGKVAGVKDGINNNVTGSKAKSKLSDFSGLKNTSNKGFLSARNKKESVVNNENKSEVGEKNKKVTGLGSPTFQEKSKFKSQQNQRLFQELDHMLTAGKHGIPEQAVKNEPMTSRSQKTEKIKVLTKDSFYQPSFQDGKTYQPKRSTYTTVPPLKQNGIIDHESQILHTRELRAKEQIASVDSYASGGYKGKLGLPAPNAGNVSSRLNTQREPPVHQGVPIHPSIVTNRNHFIADIPIYLPSFDGANPSTNPAFPDKAQTIGRGFENTIPGQANAGIQPERKLPLAPEVITGPPPELSNLTSESVTKHNTLNSYRQQVTPVRQRLIDEQSRKFARDNLKYFDLEPKNQSRPSVMNQPPSYGHRSPGLPSFRSSRDYQDDETMHSDPGSVRRSQPIEDFSKYKYSPEGFLAERERKARQDRESKMRRESERNFSSRDYGDEFKRRDPSFQGRSDRSEGSRPVLKDNSWIKADQHTPIIMDSYRKQAMREDSKPYGSSTFRVREKSTGTYRQERSNSPQTFDNPNKDTHRTYQIPSEIRNRDRYSERDSKSDGYSQANKNRDYYHMLKSDRDNKNTNDNTEFDRSYQTGRDSYREDRYGKDRTLDKRYDTEATYRRERREPIERDDKQFDKDSRDYRHYMEEKFRGVRSPIVEENRNERSFSDKRSDKDYNLERKSSASYASDLRSGGRDYKIENEKESGSRYAADMRSGDKDGYTRRGTQYEGSSYHNSERIDRYHNEPNRNDPTVRQDSYTKYDRGGDRKTEGSESASRKRKYSVERNAERRETRTKSGELKVEYVLRSKSNSTDMIKQNAKGRESTRNEPDSEITDKKELPLKKEKNVYEKEKPKPREQRRSPSPRHNRDSYSDREKVESPKEVEDKFTKPVTYETRVIKENSKHGDDFNKYFDDPENPNSPSNKIPFYSDNSGQYAKEKYEFTMPESMTPVQETSIRQPEEEVRVDVKSNPNKTSEQIDEKVWYNSTYADDITNRKPIQEKEGVTSRKEPEESKPDVKGDLDDPGVETKPGFLASTVNKHEIQEDRKSPWRKEDSMTQAQTSTKQEPKPYLEGPDFGEVKVDKRSNSFEKIKAEVRQKTEEKLQKKRERTMDSQGPTVDDLKFDYPDFRDRDEVKEEEKDTKQTESNVLHPSETDELSYKDKSSVEDKLSGKDKLDDKDKQSDKNDKVNEKDRTSEKENAEEIDIDDLNLDDVETEMDERELYVCYLMTDNGEAIGPLRLDIDDVQLGLPRPATEEEKQERQAKGADATEDEGMRNRQTGSHGLNEFSSRSHSMLMLTIDSEQQDPDDENIYITKRGKLTFVDLAGSEKVKDSHSTADTLVESNSINKSLLVLGNCISSLGDSKRRQGHIPYRDSKLTKLLADSLGGNGVTLMICCITPSSHHAPETMNTLRYASRAKKIRTKPVIKMDPREKLILSLKREVKVLRNENHYLRQQLEFPAKPRGQLQKENDQKFMKMIKEVNGKPNTNNAPSTGVVDAHPEKMKQNGNSTEEGGLYEMLQEYMVENETLRTENADMQVQRDKIRQEQQLLYRDNEKLMKRVDELERRMNQAQTSWQSMPRQGSHPDPGRSRDHSPMGSPQYIRAGGSGGHAAPHPQNRLPPPPPNDLPLRDNPALRDPVYPGSPPQGYNSPTSNGKGKQGTRGQPLKPPHRLVEPIVGQQRPIHEQNGINGHPGGHPGGHPMQYSPGGHPIQYRQPPAIGSPNRTAADLRMDSRRSSQSSSSDAIKDMNERLKAELMQLEGEIHHHTVMNHRGGGGREVYGSQGSMR